MVGIERGEPSQRVEEAERETITRRAESSSTLSSSFPETPVMRISQPPVQVNSDEEATDSEEDPERPPRKTMRMDPKQ
jgi:hypothetical protein